MKQQGYKVDGVFEGGGVRGIGLIGALSVFEEAGYEFVHVAGTSAGAIIGTLIAAGYTTAELKPILSNINFHTFTDPTLLSRIPLLGPSLSVLAHKGVYKGDVFYKLLKDLLDRKNIRTFKQLVLPEYANSALYRYKVRVVASDITRGRMLVLPQDIQDYGMQPDDLEVALAVRMSMSIPFFFTPIHLRGRYIVDGGLLSNFPVELFDSPRSPEWPTFGIKLVTSDEISQNASACTHNFIHGPVSELAALFFTAMQAHDTFYLENAKFVRTTLVDTLGINSVNFRLTAQQKEALYQSGVNAAKEFLKHWDFEEYKAQYRSSQSPPSRREQTGFASAQIPANMRRRSES